MRLVREHRFDHPSEWAAIESIAEKPGMMPEMLRKWPRRDAVNYGQRLGMTSRGRECVRELERENWGLRQATEILTAASVFFAREVDRSVPKR